MAKLNKLPLPLYNDGIIREAVIDETVAIPSSVELAVNMNFDRMGAVQTRPGTTKIGSTVEASKSVLGMHNHINNAGTNYRLLAKLDTNVYDYDGVSWNSVRSGLTAGSKARFTSFIDLTYMVNGNGNEVVNTFNGTTFGTTNVADLPKGDFIENYRSRIWVADSSTDKLFYSDVVNTDLTLSGGTSFFPISPQDGDKITGLKRHPRALLVFKRNHIYRVFSINSTDPDPSINIGTYSQESIVEAKDGFYFHHSSGFYKFQFDGGQIEISKSIRDIVDAMPRAAYDNVVGWADNDNIYWSIGDITVGGITLSNVVVRRTISTQVWTVYSYPTQITGASKYDNGTNIIDAVGDTAGDVLQVNSGNNDNGTSIFYNLDTHWYYISNSKTDIKSLTEMAAFFENAQGAEVSYKIDDDSVNTWKPIGSIKEVLTQVLSLNTGDFTRIRFRVNGNISGTSLIFRGFELLNTNIREV